MAKKKEPTKTEVSAIVAKSDGYEDTFRGAQTSSMSDVLSGNAVEMYANDPLARKIIDVIPEEMVTTGFKVDGVKDEKAFRSAWDGMKLNEKLISALCWGRLFGGALIVAIIADNRSLKTQASQGSKLESIRVYDRTRIRVGKRETNPNRSRYGEPVTFIVKPSDNMAEYEVHFSRCFVIDGDRVPDSIRMRNNGWGQSVLTPKMIEAINDYNYCEELATQLLRRKQQAVWKAKDLAMLCDDDDGRMAARLRLAQVDDNGGVGRAIGIDATDEEYEILNSDISGVDAFLDKKMDRIVNYSGIHEIIIKNRNVGGVSQSQNTALETFYKLIDRKRGEDYRPILEWLLPYIVEEEEWSIAFEPLSVPSEKEISETLSKNVDSITKAVDSQLIDVEEGRDTLQASSDIFKLKSGKPNIDKTVTPDIEIDPIAAAEETK